MEGPVRMGPPSSPASSGIDGALVPKYEFKSRWLGGGEPSGDGLSSLAMSDMCCIFAVEVNSCLLIVLSQGLGWMTIKLAVIDSVITNVRI
jgi:hypothetical protein